MGEFYEQHNTIGTISETPQKKPKKQKTSQLFPLGEELKTLH